MTTATGELPAIAGGKPTKTTPYTKLPRYGEEELAELREAIAQQTLFYAGGKKVHELEKTFSSLRGCRHGIACSSGTAAIHAATMAVGVSPGDEVIVPPITDMGTILPVMWQNAVPVFADLDPRTYNLTAETIEAAITPKTRAVIAVHLAGNPCDLRAIKELCDRKNIILIEDCAQAHGCHYDEKPVGQVGVVGCYSFNEFKHIACGDGGIAITNDDKLAEKLRLATDKGYNRTPGVADRNATFMANNDRMTELQGAVAIAQVRKLDSIISRRQSWCGRLTKRLSSLAGLQLPIVQENGTHSYWFYMMRVDPKALGASTDDFTKAVRAEGVPVSAHYIGKPIYQYPLFLDHSAFERNRDQHAYTRLDYAKVKCPVAEAILQTCVVLAVNEAYSDADLDDTVKAFERVVGYFQSKR